MDYGQLIRDAWAITWRYCFLWVLGLLAGGSVGLPSLNTGGGSRQSDLQETNPAMAAAFGNLSSWAMAHIGLLIGFAVLALLVLVALVIVSVIAQGGIAQATAELATGRTSSFGRAWSAGVRLFWRYVGLWFLVAAAGVVVAVP